MPTEIKWKDGVGRYTDDRGQEQILFDYPESLSEDELYAKASPEWPKTKDWGAYGEYVNDVGDCGSIKTTVAWLHRRLRNTAQYKGLSRDAAELRWRLTAMPDGDLRLDYVGRIAGEKPDLPQMLESIALPKPSSGKPIVWCS